MPLKNASAGVFVTASMHISTASITVRNAAGVAKSRRLAPGLTASHQAASVVPAINRVQ